MSRNVTGNMIRELREKAGLSLAETAEGIGVPEAILEDWESGKRYADLDELRALGLALGATPEELIAGKIVEKPETTGNAKADFIAAWQAQTVLSAHDRTEYFTRKWYRDHILFLAAAGFAAVAAAAAGFCIRNSWVMLAGVLLAIGVFSWGESRRNAWVHSRVWPEEKE